jgi:hypothetical protein
MFISYSAMMLHLEANTCESGSDEHDIRQLVWDYYEIYRPWNRDHDDDLDCDSCGAYFNKLSALLQHVESESCCEDISNYSGLFEYIRRRI